MRRGRHGSVASTRSPPGFRVLVLTEDSCGAWRYLKLRVVGENNLKIIVRPGRSPDAKNLVSEARAALKSGDDADYVILVFDRDHRRKVFDDAIAACVGDENMMAICSSPCIEYWFLLHFEDAAPSLEDPKKMTAKLSAHPEFAGYNKGRFDVWNALRSGDEGAAIGRSKKHRKATFSSGATVPWTEVDVLVTEIDALRKRSHGHKSALQKRASQLGK